MPHTMIETRRPKRLAANTGDLRHVGCERTFTKPEVAALPMADVRRMNSEELAAVIRAADVPLFRESVTEHLEFYDRATLEQLAFLARRTVRNQGH